MRAFSIGEFGIQLLLSAPGAIVAGVICGLIPLVLGTAIIKNTSPGNFVDHVVDQRFIPNLGRQPLFSGAIVAAFALGIFGSRVSGKLARPSGLAVTDDRHLNVVNETQTNARIAARYFPTTKTSNWPDSAVDKNS